MQDEEELKAIAGAMLLVSKLRDQASEEANRLLPVKLRATHNVKVSMVVARVNELPPKKTLGDLFTGLSKPHWLPVYDINAFMIKFDSEQPFPGSYASAQPCRQREFEEYRAILDICEMADGGLSTPAKQARIDEALEANAQDGCPNYKRLLELLKGSFGTERIPR